MRVLSLLALACVLVSSACTADPGPDAAERDAPRFGPWYGSLEAGARWVENAHTHDSRLGAVSLSGAQFSAGFDASPTVGFTLGRWLQQGMRVEGEFNFGSNRLARVDIERDGGLGARLGAASLSGDHFDARGSLDSYHAMANVFYEGEYRGFYPYVGGGVGVAVLKAHKARLVSLQTAQPIALASEVMLSKDTEAVMAWQVGGGVAYPLTQRLSATVDYRYLAAADDPEFDFAGGAGRLRTAYATHNVMLALRFRF